MSESEVLSRDEVRELTEAAKPADQIAWLNATSWVYATSVRGHPIIGRLYARLKLGYSAGQIDPVGAEPNFAAIKEMANGRNRKRAK
jgi:hypothetical protein